jgi:hypothetical protein
MSYTITWVGPTGPPRKKASSAAEALRVHTAYGSLKNFISKDEAGRRVSTDELQALVRS